MHRICIGGGDARRLGVRFLIIERISNLPFSSLFRAHIHAGNHQFIGVVKIYRLFGWKVSLPITYGLDIVQTVLTAGLHENSYALKLLLFKSVALVLFTFQLAVYAGTFIYGCIAWWGTYSHINAYYLAKGIVWLGLCILLRHVLIII